MNVAIRAALFVLVATLSLVAAPNVLGQASCMTCSLPPGGTYYCASTYYNAGDGCFIGAGGCQNTGSCQGALGECRRNNCIPIYACGEPLGNEWQLKSVEVKIAARPVQDRSKPLARKS